LNNAASAEGLESGRLESGGLERIGEVPIYHTDAIVRRAKSLQLTRDAQVNGAWMHSSVLERLGLRDGDHVRVTQDDGAVILTCHRDDRLPADCVRIATANAATVHLGAAYGSLTVEPAVSAAEVNR
jgi:NADH-quinone oxidoreductase subunit G